ncbi:hypothetical protein GDO78_013529 [Eleutherodactylus coqui]|uniref:Uncharacterized protein n=1 Tax=Eleutherodactylus coqui TaxID=57060 RepID=A0A8J6F1C6_ELECQ|nr:hypothetical protein GDO78_013529 [Eleutherodactylus coqui]
MVSLLDLEEQWQDLMSIKDMSPDPPLQPNGTLDAPSFQPVALYSFQGSFSDLSHLHLSLFFLQAFTEVLLPLHGVCGELIRVLMNP